MDAQRRKAAVALLSVVSNGTLVIGKLVIGVLSGSVSVISEAIHSGVDLLASFIALYAVKQSAKPPDEDHPFGHGKVENISGAIEALLIFVAAGWIIYEAVGKLRHPEPLQLPVLAAGVMLVSALVNIVVSQMLFKVGKETDSIALQADAWHLRTDVYTSAGVMAGLAVIWLGQRYWPEWGESLLWIDPVAAMAVALLIVKAAYDLTKQSTRDLMDTRLPAEEEAWIRELVRQQAPAVVRGAHDLRTRKSGSSRFVELHLMVPATMTVRESHEITAVISGGIKRRFPETMVTIHVDPCEGDCTPGCVAECLLSEDERAAVAAGRSPD